MNRLLAGVMWVVLGAAHAAYAVPARPLYEPPAPQKSTPSVDLRGSTWQGKAFAVDVTFTFETDGSVTYHRGGKGFKGAKAGIAKGSWSLTGDNLYFDINNKTSEHRGIVAGNVIRGESSNRSGMRGTFHLERVAP